MAISIRWLPSTSCNLPAVPGFDTALRGIFVFKRSPAAQAQEWPIASGGQGRPAVSGVHGPWLVDRAIHDPASRRDLSQYTLVLLKRGDKWNPNAPELGCDERASCLRETNNGSGKAAIAGPFPFSDPGSSRSQHFSGGREQTPSCCRRTRLLRRAAQAEIHPWARARRAGGGQPME